MGAEGQPPAADGGYARGVAHCLLVFIPVVVFLCWWLRQTLKTQQQVKAEPTAAVAESQFLSELFLLELVLVSAAELSAMCERALQTNHSRQRFMAAMLIGGTNRRVRHCAGGGTR